MNRTNDLMMKRMKKSLALMLLAMVLLLSACGQKPVFGVSTNEDNSISITAEMILVRAVRNEASAAARHAEGMRAIHE